MLGADLPLIADDVTVEHLLAHRSGIGDYLDEDEARLDDYPMPVSVHRLATTEDFLPMLDGYPTKFPAGERFSYCNGGYVVLALVAERVAGRPYHDLVRELVLGPAGMTDSDFFRTDDLPGGAAPGTSRSTDTGAPTSSTCRSAPPATAACTPPPATCRGSGRALFDGGSSAPRRWATMIRDHSPTERDGGRAYGLGFWLRPDSSEVTISGADAGVSFASQHDPEVGYTHTVIANTSDGAWPVSSELDAIVGVD